MIAEDYIVSFFNTGENFSIEDTYHYIILLKSIRREWINDEKLTISEKAEFCNLERQLMKEYLRAFVNLLT